MRDQLGTEKRIMRMITPVQPDEANARISYTTTVRDSSDISATHSQGGKEEGYEKDRLS